MKIEEILKTERELLEKRHKGDKNWIGIACSGGGIRSATFNLGILTALERVGLLKKADYLSTVSGGGYVGSYVIANRMKDQDLTDDSPANPALHHLRTFSNYLTPSVGAMSTDTWAMMMVWFRNTSLLQLFLLSVFGAVLLLPRLWTMFLEHVFLERLEGLHWAHGSIILFHTVVALICGVLTDAFGPAGATRTLAEQARRGRWAMMGAVALALVGSTAFVIGAFDVFAAGNLTSHLLFYRFCLTLGTAGFYLSLFSLGYGRGFRVGKTGYCVAGVLWAAASAFASTQIAPSFGLVMHAVLAALTLLAGPMIFEVEKQQRGMDAWRSLMAGAGCAIAAGAGILAANAVLGDWAHKAKLVLETRHTMASAEIWLYALFAAPGLLATIGCCIIVMIGVAGRAMPDIVREGWSRLGAVLYLKALFLLVIGVVGVMGPRWILEAWHGWHAYVLASGGFATAVIGVLSLVAANGGNTSGKGGAPGWKETAVKLAPLAFIVLLFCFVAMALHAVFVYQALAATDHACHTVPAVAEFPVKPYEPIGQKPNTVTAGPRLVSCEQLPNGWWQGPAWPKPKELIEFYWPLLDASIYHQWKFVWLVFGVLLLVAAGLASRLDVNEYSINRFYRNRLTRCFIGASRVKAGTWSPDPISGFDIRDDEEFEMRSVAEYLEAGNGLANATPLPVLNTALNAVGGADASLQERRAKSFFFTPFHGYSDATGGFAVKELSTGNKEGELPMGSLVAISGAAANPNMGFHTSPTVAFLLTFFNVRLGWWLGVPGKVSALKRQFNLTYIFFELFGTAEEDDAYVNLSDGGHFENLGLYELVRRKCKLIVVGDGEQDNNYVFESLGGAVRKCRIDHDVEIDIDVSAIQPKQPGGRNGRHWAVGKIHYKGEEPGYLLYLKSSFTGQEPYDVQQYRFANPEFPQQSTGDQFFDESQFESYRQLGLDAAKELLEELRCGAHSGRADWQAAARELYLRST